MTVGYKLSSAINQSEHQRINYGCYWTPKQLVDLCYSMVQPYIIPQSIFVDNSAGYGSFIARLTKHPMIATDIDGQAVDCLHQYYGNHALMIKQDNSLQNVNRDKYNLTAEDHLVIIGNPPYNDRTSKNRADKKSGSIEMDPSLHRADIGMAFLLSYALLQADLICVLHPWSYLIKQTNFHRLSPLWQNYHLLKGTIFSSHLFTNTGSTAFPIVAALYKRGSGMSYEDLRHHRFNILEDDRTISLDRIETIDGYIRKYPPYRKDRYPSDMGLYFYNFRDSNSLWTSANFTEKENYAAHITVTKQDFYKYAYISCYKRYFPRQYIFGNLSPLVRCEQLENSRCFQSACIVDTIVNYPKLQALSIAAFRQQQSELIMSSLEDNYSPLAQRLKKIAANHFLVAKDSLAAYFRDYFNQLATDALSPAVLPYNLTKPEYLDND